MPHLKLSDNAVEDVRFLALPRGVRLLHIEALSWSNRAGANGFLPRHLLRRITDERDPEAAAELLERTGWWAAESRDGLDGWKVGRWLEDQPSREDAERSADLNRQRQQRWYWHSKGQHHLCDPKRCKAASAKPNAPNGGPNPISKEAWEHEPNAPNGGPNGTQAKPSQAIRLRLGEPKPETPICALPSGGSALGGNVEERRRLAKAIREALDPKMARRFHATFRKRFGQLYPAEYKPAMDPRVMAIVKAGEPVNPDTLATNRVVYGELLDASG